MPAKISDLTTVFGSLVRSLLGLAAVALFIMLLLGGFKYITSGGDPKAVESAQKTLTYAIGGLIIVLLAFLFLVLIRTITGVDVTQFNVVITRQ